MESSFIVQNHGFSSFDSFVNSSASGSFRKKGLSLNKNAAALRSHCEAERRRRERINGHLATLRAFLPSTDKLDKATLLAEVISQVKVLKKQTIEATKGLLIPTDTDEVTVEKYNESDILDGFFTFRASLCCHYNPDLISNIRKAIDDLKLNFVRAEISTLGSRVKGVFVIKGELSNDNIERFGESIRGALCSVLDKISASEEYSFLSNKRRKVSSSSESLSPSL